MKWILRLAFRHGENVFIHWILHGERIHKWRNSGRTSQLQIIENVLRAAWKYRAGNRHSGHMDAIYIHWSHTTNPPFWVRSKEFMISLLKIRADIGTLLQTLTVGQCKWALLYICSITAVVADNAPLSYNLCIKFQEKWNDAVKLGGNFISRAKAKPDLHQMI
jgi:hypothetical protein